MRQEILPKRAYAWAQAVVRPPLAGDVSCEGDLWASLAEPLDLVLSDPAPERQTLAEFARQRLTSRPR